MLAGGRGTLSSARLAGLLLILIIAGVVGVAVRPPSEASAGEVLWVNDLRYGSVGGGFYLDTGSGQVWTAERGWHLFSPSPSRAAGPLWVNDLDYGSVGGGFYWDPLSGLVWTAERGWHTFSSEHKSPVQPVAGVAEPAANPCAASLSAALGCASRDAVREWAARATIESINSAVASLGSDQRRSLAALVLDSNAAGAMRTQLLAGIEALIANRDLGFYVEVFSYTRISIEGSGFFGGCNQVWLGPGPLSGLDAAGTRNVLAHEALHSFNCVNGGPNGALDEGSGIFVLMAAWPGEFDARATWAETTMGTKLYYRDLWEPPQPDYPIQAPASPTQKLLTVYNWLSSKDASRLPWDSTAKLQRCYETYFAGINRDTDFETWLAAQHAATQQMLTDAGCRPANDNRPTETAAAPVVTGVSTGPGAGDEVVVYVRYTDADGDGYGYEWRWSDGTGLERHVIGEAPNPYGSMSSELATHAFRVCQGDTRQVQFRVFDRGGRYTAWVSVDVVGRAKCSVGPSAPVVTSTSTGPGTGDDVVVYVHYSDTDGDGYGYEWQWSNGTGFERHSMGDASNPYGSISSNLATHRFRVCKGATLQIQFRVFDRAGLYSPWVTIDVVGRANCAAG